MVCRNDVQSQRPPNAPRANLLVVITPSAFAPISVPCHWLSVPGPVWPIDVSCFAQNPAGQIVLAMVHRSSRLAVG